MLSIQSRLRLNLEFGQRVNIDYSVLGEVCKQIAGMEKPEPFDWRDSAHFPDDNEGLTKVSQYFAVGNAINFRYWSLDAGKWQYCYGKKGGTDERGAYFMWRSLRLCDEKGSFPILDASKLAQVTSSQIKRIFMDDDGSITMPDLQERIKNWRDLGNKLYEYWSGEFYNLLKQTKGSLFRFIQYSRQFRAFDDPLCKMTMVNAIMHQGRGLVEFDEPLLPAMDYELLKQQMRMGILVLTENLKKKIVDKQILQSEEARELRNAGLRAFITMIKKTGIGGHLIDNIWWFNRVACRTDNPVCQIKGEEHKCKFLNVCHKRIEYKIPLEVTRYY